jgi:hypothetical protein
MDLGWRIPIPRLDQWILALSFGTRDRSEGRIRTESVTPMPGTGLVGHVAHRKAIRYTQLRLRVALPFFGLGTTGFIVRKSP